LPIIFIGLIAFGVFYLIRTKKINYFKNIIIKKQAPFNDETIESESNEMKFYGSNSKLIQNL